VLRNNHAYKFLVVNLVMWKAIQGLTLSGSQQLCPSLLLVTQEHRRKISENKR